MKNFWNNLSARFEEGFKPFYEKAYSKVMTHPEIFCLGLLAFLCLIFLFYGLGHYPLMDVDETRYAIMSRDLITAGNWDSLFLNYEPFLEKPPLYFWLVAHSINIFGEFSEFAVRAPIALIASVLTFATYFLGKKIISRKFGMLSSIVLLSSAFFLIFAHVAILDMVLTVFVALSIYSGFLTNFIDERYKKYAWWFFYLFAGFAFLAKGILGLIIPGIVIFTYNLLTKTLKEMFKPVNLLPGIVIFFLIMMPWHFVMYKEYGFRFIKEYFLLHHFARFIDSANIGRERPFLYFVPIFLAGFMPWTLVFIALLIELTKKAINKFKEATGNFIQKALAIVNVETNEEKLVLMASIYFFLIFLMFSVSSTKLPTYILPVFPAAALLTGFYWYKADEKEEKYRNSIAITTIIFSAVIITTAIAAVFTCLVLPSHIQMMIQDFKDCTIIGLLLTSLFLLMGVKNKRSLSVFSGYVMVMVVVIVIAVTNVFGIIHKGGQSELEEYASYASNESSRLITFDFAVKPSVRIKYNDKVEFVTEPDVDYLNGLLNANGRPVFVIIKNKHFRDSPYESFIKENLKLIQMGDKYSLFVKAPKLKIKKIKKMKK